MYPYNNPYQPYVQFQSSQNQLIKVNGLESAKAYQTQPNSTVALFDSNDDIFYIKSTDASNFPIIRKFRFTEEVELSNNNGVDTNNFITREEFLEFKKEVLKNGKQSISQSNKQSNTANSNGKPNKTESGSDIQQDV